MAEKQHTPSKPEDQPPKQPAETVHLTAEDLRKISGGANNPPTVPVPKDIRKQ